MGTVEASIEWAIGQWSERTMDIEVTLIDCARCGERDAVKHARCSESAGEPVCVHCAAVARCDCGKLVDWSVERCDCARDADSCDTDCRHPDCAPRPLVGTQRAEAGLIDWILGKMDAKDGAR